MNIVICEDDLEYCNFIRSILSAHIKEKNSNARIAAATSDVDVVMDYIQNNSEITVYYLDIKLRNGKSGFDIASAIRAKDRQSHIIFITNYDELMSLTYEYKLEALDYIVKNDTKNVKRKLCEGLDFAEKRRKINYVRCLNIKNKQRNFSVPFTEICYIESIKNTHKLVLYYDHGMITFYGLLKDVEQQLDDRFIRCHRSIIVNKDKIENIDEQNRILELRNGYRCACSAKCKELI